jgi:cob(I)alamin adenosyltransferase
MKIYTRTGDRGETGLIGGRRVAKDSQRILAYGAVDELNSSLGLAIAFLRAKERSFSDLVEVLVKVQNDLFVLGSDLADPDSQKRGNKTPRVDKKMSGDLETVIDRFEGELDPITFFILPGGATESSLLHQCRAIARRTETSAVSLSRADDTNPEILVYLNRLSDLLFVSARLVNKRLGVPDVAWHSR